ncbi:MAG TPA: hypothetical protein VKV36_04755 [Acidimicrobiales bacterium]|nr:hypothetical protein [Acidimicrobiales bacterium]
MTRRRSRRGLLLVALVATLAATTAGLARRARRRDRLATPPSLDAWPAVPRAPHKAGG